MGIFLGNLTVEQLQSRLGIALTDEEVSYFNSNWQQYASGLKSNEWHCFDIPLFISCGSMNTAVKINDILSKYDNRKESLQIGIDDKNNN